MAIQKRKRSGKGRVEAAKRPRAEAQSQGSSFLGLPAEIRNAIYELALTAPGDLTVHWEAVSTSPRSRKKPVMMASGTSSSESQPINSLRYVNRQQYKETAGLEIKFNRVVFEDPEPKKATERFLDFISQATPARLTWLKAMALEEKAARNEAEKLFWTQSRPGSLVEIMRFCARNRHTTVDLREPGFEIITRDGDLQAYKFLGAGIILTLALRGQDIVFMATFVFIPRGTPRGDSTMKKEDKSDDVCITRM
jgi:hypothetical protein